MTTALILQETQNLTDGLTRTAVIISDGDGRCGEAWVMHITERSMRQVTEQDYTLSVVDTDADELSESARLRATDLKSAWERAIVISISRLSWFRRIPDHHQRAQAQRDKIKGVWQHK
jgi:hypothetical protein